MAKRVIKKKKECLYCKVNNKKSRDKTFIIVATDRPYKNIWFHRSCLVKLGDGLGKFLTESRDVWDEKMMRW